MIIETKQEGFFNAGEYYNDVTTIANEHNLYRRVFNKYFTCLKPCKNPANGVIYFTSAAMDSIIKLLDKYPKLKFIVQTDVDGAPVITLSLVEVIA